MDKLIYFIVEQKYGLWDIIKTFKWKKIDNLKDDSENKIKYVYNNI